MSLRPDFDFAQLVSFDTLPPLLLPSLHTHTCSDKFCRIQTCLADQFSIILSRIPVTHLRAGPVADNRAGPRVYPAQSLVISISGAGFPQMRVWGS